jgi:peptidoglycan/LPS O-acetylase OafA/YrhL
MMEKQRFIGLDGLRGVCAIAVMLGHCELLFRPGVVVCHAYLAVDMFFMLSGFVISASYDGRFEQGLGAWRFLLARIRRLAPVYWGGMVLCTIAALLAPHPSSLALLMTAAMGAALIPVLGPGTFAYPVNFVAWSLFWELAVNIAYALGLRRLCGFWLAAFIVLPLMAAFVFAGINPRHWTFGMTGLDLWLGGLRALPEFLFGTLLHRAWRAGALQRLPVVTPLLPLAVWLAISVVPQDVPPVFDLVVVVLVCPLLIGLLLRGDFQAPAWFRWLGGISYPLYASHLAWIGLAQHTPLFGLNHAPDPLRALGVVAVCLTTAWLLYRTLDPAGRAGTRVSGAFLAQKPAMGACEARPKPL